MRLEELEKIENYRFRKDPDSGIVLQTSGGRHPPENAHRYEERSVEDVVNSGDAGPFDFPHNPKVMQAPGIYPVFARQ